MKMTTLKTVAIAVGLASSAFGQATSPVVGYETLALDVGFNYVGLRLHEKPVASGELETVSATSVVDNDVDLGALMDGSTFILEIENAEGVIQEVTSATGTGLVTADTSGIIAPVSYTLRPSSTLASVFGAANSVGLATGSFGNSATADEVWIFNGAGFDKYYYDTFNSVTFGATWSNVNGGAAVDANAIDLVYADAIIINSKSGTDVVVSGDLKSTVTELNLVAGFNFVGSVAPVGDTLQDAFGVANSAGFATGSFGSSATADEIWVFNGAGFDKYYYDTFNSVTFGEAWSNVSGGAAVDPSTVSLGAGYVINKKTGGDVTSSLPDYYDGL